MIQAGDTIGPYTLIRTLGRGAFGEVWLAERRSSLLTTQVALKLPLDSATDLDLIRNEAQLWLRASGHPNIVPVMDAEVYDGQVVIASEYEAGGSLEDWLVQHGGKAPSVDAAVGMMRGILNGLQHLHEIHLVHRDVKPGNVLLQKEKPRLTDFGLTRVIKPSLHTTNLAGTPGYMSPEAFKGRYSIASDLWAAGIVLHELLTGTLPYAQTEFYSLLLAITSEAPVVLSDKIPGEIERVLSKALAKAPSERFASAAEMALALDSCLAPGSAPGSRAQAEPRNNLPQQVTSFIGREIEIEELINLIGKTRLLTVTGSGGCGKTRLCMQLATRVLDHYPDGVWLVELAPLSDPGLVPQVVASVLGLREEPARPILQTLVRSLKPKNLLLLLDNCEHLLTSCAQLADSIIHACPNVFVLASSREGLGIAGETVYRVPSLSVPSVLQTASAVSIGTFDAVRLFVDRATAAGRHQGAAFAVTNANASALASICRRLDGIPLAIELAAARVRALSVEEINARLDNRFRLLTGGSKTAVPRQQTLRALIDWSYDLLNAPEKTLLCRLSVFMGGWTIASAEAVCIDEEADISIRNPDGPVVNGMSLIERWDVLDLLASLVDKSLVVAEQEHGHTRYRLLETVRQYARDRLAESGDGETVRDRHQAFFIALAEEAEPHLVGPGLVAWLHRLESEHDNLRAALRWTNQEGALRIAGSMWRFWDVRSYFSEGREWLKNLLAATFTEGLTVGRGKALRGAGSLAMNQGNYSDARPLLQESLELYENLGDKEGVAVSLNNLGRVVWSQGDYSAARTLFEESQAIQRELGNKWGVASSLVNLGTVANDEGDYAAARALYGEGLTLVRELGDKQGVAIALLNLGEVAHEQGDYVAARALNEEGLAISRELGDKQSIAWSLDAFAALASVQEQSSRAPRLWGAAEALREEISLLAPPGDRLRLGRQVAKARDLVGETAFAADWSEGRAMTMEQAIAYALEGPVPGSTS